MPPHIHTENVSVPYEITLLSNPSKVRKITISVSVPYEITLLSNANAPDRASQPVSVPYEITLLSNTLVVCLKVNWFQYLMKLHYSQTIFQIVDELNSFSTL